MAGQRGKRRGEPKTPGSGRRPVDAETRARCVELATTLDDNGRRRTRNAIAKLLGISSSTVTRIVREDGPEGFTWEGQAAAVVAQISRQRDLKAERQSLSADIITEAQRLIGKLTAPHESIHWDKDGFMHRGSLDGPLSGDVKNYAIALGILLDKHLVLVKADTDDRELASVDEWIDWMQGEGVPA